MDRLAKEDGTIEVLIVVPHHVGRLIDRCLASLKALHKGDLQVKVVVVTSTTEVFPEVITLQHMGGPAEKRNVAVQVYGQHSDYYLFLDDDVEVSPYAVWAAVQEMEQRPKVAIGFAKILKMDRRDIFDDCGSWLTPTGFLWSRAGNETRDQGQFDEPCPVLASKSATCVVRREAFQSAGGFDRDYYILGEETDLAWRCWLLGWECWYFPSILSWHAFGTSLKPKAQYYTLERIHYLGAKNYLTLLLTNLGGFSLCTTLPIHLLGWIVSAAGFTFTGNFRRSLLILRGMRHSINGRTLAKRRRVQTARVVSDQLLFRRVLRNPGAGYYLGRVGRYVAQGLHGAIILLAFQNLHLSLHP